MDRKVTTLAAFMEPTLLLGYRQFTTEDIELIKGTVREFKHLIIQELAATISEILPRKEPNGKLNVTLIPGAVAGNVVAVDLRGCHILEARSLIILWQCTI